MWGWMEGFDYNNIKYICMCEEYLLFNKIISVFFKLEINKFENKFI